MKKFILTCLRKPILIAGLIVLIFYLPIGLATPPEGVDFVHAATIGVDKSEEGVEVSILTFVISPSKNYSENLHLLSAKAYNVSEALELIGVSVGKRVVLYHTGVIILGYDLAQESAVEPLNYLFRTRIIPNDTFVVTTNGTAKELMEAEQELVSGSGASLDEVALFAKKNFFVLDINLEAFYKGYFGESKTSITAYLELLPEDTSNQKNQNNSGSGGGLGDTTARDKGEGASPDENTGGSGEPKSIQNLNKTAVYYDGKLKTILQEEPSTGLSWVSPNLKETSIQIDNVTDENFTNADLVFSVEGHRTQVKAYFIDNRPVIDYVVDLIVDFDQVKGQDIREVKGNISNIKTYLSDTVKDRIEYAVKLEFADGLNEIIKQKTDTLGVYKHFKIQNYTKFVEWLNNLEDPSAYLDYIEFYLTVNTRSIR